jgi:exonuclease VII large subunit
VEHSQNQIQEHARDAAENASELMSEAGESAAANFVDRAAQLGREQFDALQSKTSAAFDQNVARMEAQTIQVRSKLESDTRAFSAEFQRVISQHAQQSLERSATELASQVGLAKESLRVEADSLDQQMRTSAESITAKSMDEYKQRLENASNTWLLTTVSRLNQQSEGLIEQLSATTEKRLKAVCASVFAETGETLRQRLAGVFMPPANPAPSTEPPANKPSETDPREQK